MFEKLKKELNLIQVVQDFTNQELKQSGTDNWVLESDVCPSCGHQGCFKLYLPEGEEDKHQIRCWSEDLTWDAVGFVAKIMGTKPIEAAKHLAKKYNIKLPAAISPLQELYNMVADYYHNSLLETCSQSELGGLTPLEYQQQARGHNLQTLTDFKIGWSDGNLIDYLTSVGIDANLIQESGLINKKGQDFFPAKLFIYPQYVGNKVSGFTQKDPLKRLDFQLPKRFRINSVIVYGQDTLPKEGTCIIVEGENDLLSVVEAGHTGPIFCVNGSISREQLEWLSNNLAGRDVITIFDPDQAGELYKEKFTKLKTKFRSLRQINLTAEEEDIDYYLRNGGSLDECIARADTPEEEEESEEKQAAEVEDPGDIQVKDGCYYKIKFKDGEPYLFQLSDFTMQLKNIYIKGADREREIVIRRRDGKSSTPLKVNSDAKVSLKPFKTLVANAVDATFYGKEEDMAAVWEHVYRTSDEKVVYLTDSIGRMEEFNGWLFGNCFISDTGAKYYPDNTGAIWLGHRDIGVKPTSLISANNGIDSSSGIPRLELGAEEDEIQELLKRFIENLGRNLGNLGHALLCISWMWATVYSNVIFKKHTFFPYLFVWGKTRGGKSTIMGWLRALFDMVDSGVITVKTYGSGVAFSRKLFYYSSLPMCIDELRNDQDSMNLYAGFRTWYNRIPRDVGDLKSKDNIVQKEVRATIMCSGEDHFSDPASRNRCISVRIASDSSREMRDTYNWIENNKDMFPAIGYKWISDFANTDKAELIADMMEKENELRDKGFNSRAAKTWGIVYYFGSKLCEEFFPEYDYRKYILNSVEDDSVSQDQDDTLTKFWEMIEGMYSEERSKINSDHLKRDGDDLYFWYAEAFRQFSYQQPRNQEPFSSSAVRELIREQPYFKEEGRERMGIREIMRRVMVLDISQAPEVIKRIADGL